MTFEKGGFTEEKEWVLIVSIERNDCREFDEMESISLE